MSWIVAPGFQLGVGTLLRMYLMSLRTRPRGSSLGYSALSSFIGEVAGGAVAYTVRASNPLINKVMYCIGVSMKIRVVAPKGHRGEHYDCMEQRGSILRVVSKGI